MSSRRILIVTNRVPYPLHDGGAMAMDAMIRGYHDQGWEVRALAMNTTRHFVGDEKIKTLYPEIAGFEAIPFDNALKPLNLLKNLLLSSEPEHAERFYSKDFEERLLAVIKAFQPDVIQIESLFLSGYLPATKESSKALLVLRMHNIEYEVWERMAAQSKGLKARYLGILAKRMRRFEARIWKQYDLLLAITKADAETVRQYDKTAPVIVAPFGIDVDTTSVPTTPDDFTKTYHVGAMDWLPNAAAIDWLIQDIWPEVRKQVPEATFHFAGRHMPERFQHQLPEGVYCYGEVPDVTTFVADKNVLLVPLRAGGGIRVKILEAMAAGKLVISTDVGMQGIDAVPGVHYLQANTPEAFAIMIKWCANDVAAARSMIIAARELIVTNYSLTMIIRQVIGCLGS